ncbi:YdbL family protein [Phenylobacterium sp. LjRoot219]|uniref:YdbL family protein n=1 Tax=Phenylobacterium sp. LjRoot219 TaxID=3342283 RepID=UPI003ECF00AB
MQTRDILGVGAAVLAALALPAAAVAQSAQAKAAVDSAKAAGVVGEQADGFLGFVTGGGDPALRSAVAEINAGRAQVYREAAARTGATPEAAGAAAFVNVVQPRIQPGQFYKPNGGGWVKK